MPVPASVSLNTQIARLSPADIVKGFAVPGELFTKIDVVPFGLGSASVLTWGLGPTGFQSVTSVGGQPELDPVRLMKNWGALMLPPLG